MKVLIAEDGRCRRDFLQNLVEQNQGIQVSGLAVDVEDSPESLVASELRRILDGCPICDGGFRNHSYFKLASIVVNEETDDVGCLAPFLRCMRDCRWDELLGFREWTPFTDTVLAFAFRCNKGRVGIVTVLSHADAESPDEPLQFTILSVKEGKRLLEVVGPGRWMRLRPTLHLVH